MELSSTQLVTGLIVFYILLGTFMESFAMLVTTVPILAPALIAIGVDLVWFGMIKLKALDRPSEKQILNMNPTLSQDWTYIQCSAVKHFKSLSGPPHRPLRSSHQSCRYFCWRLGTLPNLPAPQDGLNGLQGSLLHELEVSLQH